MAFFLSMHGVLFLYVLIRLVVPLRLGRPAKIALGLLLLLISQHYLVRMAFGRMASPETPRWLILVEGWCFAVLVLLFLFTLLRDCVWLARRAAPRRAPKSFSPERRAALFAALAAGTALYGVSKGVEVPEVRSRELRLPRLPRELDGLAVAHLTDIHISPLFPAWWAQALVERVNAAKPDLILLSGDLVDGAPGLRARDIAPLRDLRAPYGVFGCTGNHEYYSGFQAWMPVFSGLGISMLLNSHALLSIQGHSLAVAGVTDPVAGGFGLPLPAKEAALRGIPEGVTRIMLEHRPGSAAESAAAGADLQLSGHTHGGHALGLDRLVARFNGGYVYGAYMVGPMPLYVSSGAGLWNGFPLRLGVPSEIARIVLRSV